MSETIIDYEKTNKHLPESLRDFVGATNRVSRTNIKTYLAMYQGVEQLAVFNNSIAAEFGSGFVYSLNYRYLRSGVAPRLTKILVSKTVSNATYQTNVDETEVATKFKKSYFNGCLYKGFSEAAITGRSLMCVYKNELSDNVNLLTYNLFRHRVRFDEYKNIVEAWVFLANQSEKVGIEFIICEHRYYTNKKQDNGTYKKVPCQQFEVYKSTYESESKKDAKSTKLEKQAVPEEILKAFPHVKFYKENELMFSDLGVYDIKFTEINTKFLDSDIPEAMFVDAVDNAATIDTSITDKEVEKEVGRAQIMIPEFAKPNIEYPMQSTVGSHVMMTLSKHYKDPIIKPYPSMSMEDCKPTNVQFDIRSEQWKTQIDDDICRLCANVGIGVIDYDARLIGGASGTRTDDEINALTDQTANTVKNFRDINTEKVNALLSCVLEALGYEDTTASIRWSMSSILNPTKNADLVIKKLQAGLISRKAAIQQANPDLSDEEVTQMMKQIDSETDSRAVPIAFNNF